jgi:hypothetical protein
MTNEQPTLAACIEALGDAVNSRRWGRWSVQQFARYTVQWYPEEPLAHVYAFMIFIKAGNVKEAMGYFSYAVIHPAIDVDRLIGLYRDLCLYYVKAGYVDHASRALTVADRSALRSQDPNQAIVLTMVRGLVVERERRLPEAWDLLWDAHVRFNGLGDAVNRQWQLNTLYHMLRVALRRKAPADVQDMLQQLRAHPLCSSRRQRQMGVVAACRAWWLLRRCSARRHPV